jgi:hypothetical protein
MRPIFILLDIDGVLVKPGGYKIAMQETCRSILELAGLEKFSPDEEVYSLFEAQRVTSEWDMVPLSLLIVLNAVSGIGLLSSTVCSWSEAAIWLKSKAVPDITIPYAVSIAGFSQHILPGITAAQGILKAKLDGHGKDLFPHLENPSLIKDLLGDTRNVSSRLVRKFQEYVLGGEIFWQCYGEKPGLWHDSYLLKHDINMLAPDVKQSIHQYINYGRIFSSIYTARPSLPPREVSADFRNYSPEAELAVNLCGLDTLPLIGYGKLGYLATRIGSSIPDLIKPAPVQALAGVAAAWSGNEWLGLQWAAGVGRKNQDQPSLDLPKELDFYILEDSAAGIQGGWNAVEVLERSGWSVAYHPLGISQHPEKINALERVGAEIFPDVNTALKSVFINFQD